MSEEKTEKIPEAEPAVAVSAATDGVTAVVSPMKSVLVFVGLGILGGLIGGFLIHEFDRYFIIGWPEDVEPGSSLGGLTPEQMEAARISGVTSAYANNTLHFGMVGALVAALMGLAGGLLERSPRTVARGVVTGLIAGSALGALGGVSSVVIRELVHTSEPHSDLMAQAYTMAIQFPSWLGVAVASAVAVCGCSVRGFRQFPGLLGAAAAGVLVVALVYPTAASMALPNENSNGLVPTAHEGPANRIFWGIANATVMALLLGWQASAGDRRHANE